MHTITFEAHLLAKSSAYCPQCQDFTATDHLIALVDPESLAVLSRVCGTVCPCGFEEHHRLT